MAPTVLITGAAGRTSGAVIQALLDSQANLNLRLFVRSEVAIEKLQSKFPQLKREAYALGDYLEQGTLGPALEGVDIVFYNGPPFHTQEVAMGVAIIDAARDAGVKHFVYCSAIFPLLHKMMNHEVKLHVEEYLIESGLNFTILEPTCFMQNIKVKEAVEQGVLYCASATSVLQGYIALEDLAAITVLVLLNPELHNRARYELVGQNASLEDVANIIGRDAGRPVPAELVPRDQVGHRSLLPTRAQTAYAQEGLDRMLFYYDRRGIPGNNNTVRWLLGREPMGLEDYVKTQLLGIESK